MQPVASNLGFAKTTKTRNCLLNSVWPNSNIKLRRFPDKKLVLTPKLSRVLEFLIQKLNELRRPAQTDHNDQSLQFDFRIQS